MYEIRKNVPYSPSNARKVVRAIRSGESLPPLPAPNGPHEINTINQYAYTLLSRAVLDMKPREVAFVGRMAAVNYMTPKQDKWLRDLYRKHLTIEIPAITA